MYQFAFDFVYGALTFSTMDINFLEYFLVSQIF